VQVKLLRVIEQLEVTPVGDTQPRKSAFRAITATSRQLQHQFNDGTFRQDLYFRLAVFEIHVPPLRARVDDIPLLAERFLERIAAADGRSAGFTRAALNELCRRRWPGNVRELRNAVEHAALMARGGAIGPEHLPPPIEMIEPGVVNAAGALGQAVRCWAEERIGAPESAGQLYDQFLAATESSLFETVLHHTLHNRAAAADLLGIHRATLRKKLH
jgi:two-component system nitrogen regulation response regulator GlnG